MAEERDPLRESPADPPGEAPPPAPEFVTPDAPDDAGQEEGYRVELDVFTGPLDLLLYLIKKEELDIYDIPISKILDQYLAHLEVLRLMELDDVGDFLVMAAQLMLIKARMLVPEQVDLSGDDEEIEDPRTELVQKLLEYKRYKEAALTLEVRREARNERFERGPDRGPPEEDPDAESGALQVELWDLVEAFARIVREVGAGRDLVPLNEDDLPMHVYAEEIIGRLHRAGRFYLDMLFEGVSSRYHVISYFMAILELVRTRRIRARQREPFGRILLEPAPEPIEEAAPETPAPQFEAVEARDVLHEPTPPAEPPDPSG
jgi:segregation and condensation protein A